MVSTNFGDETHVMRSIEAGAAGYLLKDSSPARMGDEIRSLASGGSPISPHHRAPGAGALPQCDARTGARSRQAGR
jgi:DNA-binding NarL/FixJ family response regulator